MLIEVTRKIWMGLIMDRVRSFWSKHRLLDERQHAYLRGKGTQTAIPQFINAMETAREFATDLFMSSWDMSKAFDNLSREMILICLRRLHIPLELANYIISLDEEDIILVRTPWLLEKLRSSDPNLSTSGFFSTQKGEVRETSPPLFFGLLHLTFLSLLFPLWTAASKCSISLILLQKSQTLPMRTTL
jgi:hypothetical protein